MNKYSPELVDAIKAHIKEQDLHMVAFDEELGRFSFNMHLPARFSSVNIMIRVGENEFSTMAVCPVRPDAEDRELMARMAEFVCRANFGLRNGCFEFDFNDGELRYRCYVPCGERVPDHEAIHRAIATPALMFRRYAPGIIGVLYNGRDPAEMVRECEDDSVGRRVYEEMSRSREELKRRLGIKPTAEQSGELPSFDEFVNMDAQPDAAPDSTDGGGTDNGTPEE